mmetsp:Transcript_35977/g.112507  ORF Transcript_35977/g.112507 Transcript_35977/m.112507 type:complete len:243 (-) Transcript_35977:137-865(-)
MEILAWAWSGPAAGEEAVARESADAHPLPQASKLHSTGQEGPSLPLLHQNGQTPLQFPPSSTNSIPHHGGGVHLLQSHDEPLICHSQQQEQQFVSDTPLRPHPQAPPLQPSSLPLCSGRHALTMAPAQRTPMQLARPPPPRPTPVWLADTREPVLLSCHLAQQALEHRGLRYLFRPRNQKQESSSPVHHSRQTALLRSPAHRLPGILLYQTDEHPSALPGQDPLPPPLFHAPALEDPLLASW